VDASTGIITVYAGQLLGGWSNTQLRNPEGIAFDSQGNLYVADRNNNAIRKVIPPVPPAMRGTLTTVAGLGPDSPGCSGDGGPAAAATLNEPQDVAVDASGNIYIADAACRRIRMIGSDGKISTVVGTGAGSGPEGPHPPFNGPADALQVNLGVPVGVKADSAGNLYISDSAFEVVWFYDQNSKTVSVIAGLAPGTKLCPDGSNGYGDGCVGPKAPLNVPYRVALDGNGNLYIPEQGGTSAPMPPFAVRVLSGISH